MKKNRVYSTSDFASANIAVTVEDCYWVVDSVSATNVGSYSKLPLFEVQLKKAAGDVCDSVPAGVVDRSADLLRNRTYFVREKRPLYNELAELWTAVNDRGLFTQTAKDLFHDEDGSLYGYRGHVVRLSGISYEKDGHKEGTTIIKNRLELWYPYEYEPEVILDDFVALCNKGEYRPILEEKPDPIALALKNLDPAVIAAIKAMK